MKKLLLSILTITAFSFNSNAQINDLPVSGNPSSVCSGGSSIVSTTGSQIGVNYSLRNSSNTVVDGPISGTGNNLNFNTGAIPSAETFNVYAVEDVQQSSINFDGNDDYTNLTSNTRGMTNQGSVACWVKTSASGSNKFLISNYDNTIRGFLLYLDVNGKAGIAGRDGNIISPQYGSSGPSTTSVDDGQWHYLVGTMEYNSGAGGIIWSIYVDGALESTATLTTNGLSLASNTTPLVLGLLNGSYFSGSIDDVAIWNIALDATTIATNFTNCLAGNETGLTGYFNMDEGTGATITDLSSTAINGTMVNMFPAASWVAQSTSPCLATPATLQMTQTATINIITINDETISGPASICSGSSATISTGNSVVGVNYTLKDGGGNIISGPTAGTGSGLGFSTGTISNTTTYNVIGEVLVSRNHALSFDGANDYIYLTNDDRTVSTQVSVSCWVKSTASGANQYLVDKYSGASGYLLYFNSAGKAAFDGKGTGGSYFTSGPSTTSVNDGQWHYITGATTLGVGGWKVYVDGVLESGGSLPNGSSLANGANLAIGGYGSSFSNVEIDDVSIWNKELSLSEIQFNMNNCLTGSETGIIGLFNFNNGTGTTLKDYSPSAIDGALTNMDPATDWIIGTASSCSSLITDCSLTMTQTVTITVAPTYNQTETVSVCSGASYTFPDGTTQNNITSQIIYVSNLQTVGLSCDSTINTTVNVNPIIDNTANLVGNTLTSNQTGASYRWLDCDNGNAIISGETNISYTPSVNGNYAVEITMNTCMDTSACENIIITAINEIKTITMTISPNPTQGILTINTIEEVEQITIYSVSGSLVKNIFENINQVNVEWLTEGMYILVVKTSNGITRKRFIKE